ncbi:hypothetical protein [Psychromonas sp. MME2]|uniref:WYL domain-containing protein n=1 Tax=Psychromonas sp. MME2 TaxID=3231033 RepID=UPI00339CF56F
MKKSDIERFNYIEYIVWWEGQINASHLMRHFDLSRDSASSILKNYDSQYPNNLQYDQSIKARVITENFQPLNDVSSFDGYLNLIKNANHEAISNCIEEVATPLRNINAQLLRPILKAIREQLAIDIGYISLTSPDYLDRIIEPHSLIFDGLRWHVQRIVEKMPHFEILFYRVLMALPFLKVKLNARWNKMNYGKLIQMSSLCQTQGWWINNKLLSPAIFK